MPLSPRLLAGAAFLAAAGLSVVAAQSVTNVLEDRSADAVAARLAQDGIGWARVIPDGLMVVLEGEAPTESARFEAISSASKAVDGARVIDNLRVAEAAEVAAPEFALEILRNDAGASLIGLIPADSDRDAVAAEAASAAGAEATTDLLETADHPAPEGWDPALRFALDALALLDQARLSVAPGRVAIEALAPSPEEARRLESELEALVPDEVRLDLTVDAPRPVIAPFALRATLQDGRLAFDACAADTEAARDAILAAAEKAGAEDPPDCRLGLGAPSPEWGTAAVAGLDALAALGGGTLTLSDADVTLAALPGTDPDTFEEATAALDTALPEPFVLAATNPPAPEAEARPEGPPEVTATLSEEGALRLQGPIEDARMAALALAFAKARFGADNVSSTLRPRENLPEGWSLRVLAGLEALSPLAEGSALVTPDRVAVEGRTGREAAQGEIAARAIETLGAGATLDLAIAYDESLDPLASLPTPEDCLARVTAVTDAAKVTFEPGSATISREGEPVIEAIAEILRSCPDLRLQISGYTDSQGREDTNLRLSQERAEAVLAALRSQRVPVAGFEARGFGEASPIASNETEAGREANRRIEFTLMGDVSTTEAPAAAPTGEAPPVRANLTVSAPGMAKPDAPPLRPEGFEEAAREALDEETFDSLLSDDAPAPATPPEATDDAAPEAPDEAEAPEPLAPDPAPSEEEPAAEGEGDE